MTLRQNRNAQRIRVLRSDLTGHAYVVDRYLEWPDGNIEVRGPKIDVTEDVVRTLMAEAWARGWNDCNSAEATEAWPNPYREI